MCRQNQSKGKHMSIEAMKQALDALDTCQWDYDYEEEPYKTFDDDLVNNATEALRQAIEQAEKQEPVAWLVRDYVDGFRYVSSTENPSGTIAVLSEPLYTAPPKREWVGLTDEEINDFDKKLRDHNDYCSLHFAWGISAKLKEKNGG